MSRYVTPSSTPPPLRLIHCKVIAHELSATLCSLRLANVYDLSSRIFLFKFAKPNSRQQIIVDSGFRCHLTNFTRATAAAPSAFVSRLRKFLRTRRVTKVSQVGTDRIIEFEFSDGQYRLFLEFYAGGNVVLTDNGLNVLALLRVVQEEREQLRVGLKYSMENRQNYGGVRALSKDRVKEGLKNASEKAKADEAAGKKQKKKSKPGDALRKALAVTLTELPPMLLEHALIKNNFPSSTPIENVLKDEGLLDSLLEVINDAKEIVDQTTAADVAKGYIVAKVTKSKEGANVPKGEPETDKENLNLMFEDFHPFRPSQFEGSPEHQTLEFDGFNKTVDEFFSSIESQKLESRLSEREANAKRKLDAARLDHERRLGGLQQVQELNVRKAQAIEGNLQRVQEATAAVNGLIAQGMDWVDVARLIETEQTRQNPVAEIIKLPLKLDENTITLLLAEGEADPEDEGFYDQTESEYSDSEDDSKAPAKAKKAEENKDERLAVDIDLALSGWSNARQYYEQKKTAAVKEQKTLQASEMALKSTERKINADLKKTLKQEKQVLRPVRKQLWFEKFFYFISSEGYLVLGGKDAHQNEILYKKYLSKGDVYVHADLQGASSVVVKNKVGLADSPIPPSTLGQAGTFSVATSYAWDSKAVMAAWWVNADQVSKTGQTGEYLGMGAFNIRGEKNFLPPAQLLLGFGVMFQVSDESKARHLKHRVQDDMPKAGNETELRGQTGEPPDEVEDDGTQAESDHIQENNDDGPAPSTNGVDYEAIAEGEDEGGDDGEHNEESYVNPLQSGTANWSRTTVEGGAEPSDKGSDEASSEDEVQAVTENIKDLSTVDDMSDATGASLQNPKQAPQVRGKHGKHAKMKKKYADQDEEDRALALRLLGSKAGQEKAKVEAEKKVTKEAEQAAQKERRREQHRRTQQSGKEAEEARRHHMEEGVDMLDEDEVAELGLVDSFLGNPRAGDEILDCLVVCAPWDAMGARFKWRVKIQPGSQKKGKAVKEILEHWGKAIADREKRKMPEEGDDRYAEEKVARREGELIKGFRDVEVVGVVPVGKVRTMMPGGGAEKAKSGKGGKGGGRGGKGSKKAR